MACGVTFKTGIPEEFNTSSDPDVAPDDEPLVAVFVDVKNRPELEKLIQVLRDNAEQREDNWPGIDVMSQVHIGQAEYLHIIVARRFVITYYNTENKHNTYINGKESQILCHRKLASPVTREEPTSILRRACLMIKSADNAHVIQLWRMYYNVSSPCLEYQHAANSLPRSNEFMHLLLLFVLSPVDDFSKIPVDTFDSEKWFEKLEKRSEDSMDRVTNDDDRHVLGGFSWIAYTSGGYWDGGRMSLRSANKHTTRNVLRSFLNLKELPGNDTTTKKTLQSVVSKLPDLDEKTDEYWIDLADIVLEKLHREK